LTRKLDAQKIRSAYRDQITALSKRGLTSDEFSHYGWSTPRGSSIAAEP